MKRLLAVWAMIFVLAFGCGADDEAGQGGGGVGGIAGAGGISGAGGAAGGAAGAGGISAAGGTAGGAAGAGGSVAADASAGSSGLADVDSGAGLDGGGESGPCSGAVIVTAQDLQQVAGCTSISGDLQVADNAVEITDLDALSSIQAIEGSLILFGPSLIDINGLGNLVSVGGSLAIQSATLTNVDGLQNLESVGTDLYIMGCFQLADLNGLGKLTSLGGQLTIRTLPRLPTCQARDLVQRLGMSTADLSQFVCGTLPDECGGVDCPSIT
jgi:hypothetical protein